MLTTLLRMYSHHLDWNGGTLGILISWPHKADDQLGAELPQLGRILWLLGFETGLNYRPRTNDLILQ